MRTGRTPARMRGISLIEMLIALSILGMMAAVALGGVRLGVRTWETVGTRVATESHRQIVRGFLRHSLTQVLSVLESSEADGPRPLFTGDGDSLSLVAPLGDHLGLGGAQRLSFAVEEMRDGDARRLVMERTLYHPPGSDSGADSAAGSEPERHVLIEGAARIRFGYLRDDGAGGRDWTGRWADEPTLPLAIRIRVESDDDRTPWPDLVVPLRVTAMTGRL